MADSDEAVYEIGDGDLVLLGLAAALAARFELRRKGGVQFAGLPASDTGAIALVQKGIEWGRQWPLDDVPELRVIIRALPEALGSVILPELRQKLAAQGFDAETVEKAIENMKRRTVSQRRSPTL